MSGRTRIRRTHGGSTPPRPQPRIPDYIDTSLVRARSRLSDGDATRQMASDMREAAYREGGLTEGGLQLLGYTPGQIKLLAPQARIMANEQTGLS